MAPVAAIAATGASCSAGCTYNEPTFKAVTRCVDEITVKIHITTWGEEIAWGFGAGTYNELFVTPSNGTTEAGETGSGNTTAYTGVSVEPLSSMCGS